MSFEMIALRQNRRVIIDELRKDANGIKSFIEEFDNILLNDNRSDVSVYILLGKMGANAERIQEKVNTWREILHSEHEEYARYTRQYKR